ncbi:replication protein A 70 kDa DNA-binding subunit B-like [Senna tora]|uniref:Replication protein A 70 kDa DNA-binding subunit B-like n=1 Tax=Senna tora TaxID=362788 RepID=A0A834TQC5_9FABA|nr:replication protein A 70 kDa DNA-binding subunit B-like [Senna tora]
MHHQSSCGMSVVDATFQKCCEKERQRWWGNTDGYVTESRVKVGVALWGHYAEQIEQCMSRYRDGPVFIGIQWCKIKELNGQHNLTNSMHATRIMINEDIDDFRNFGENLPLGQITNPLNGSSSSSLRSASPNDDPFSSMSVTCISDLLLADTTHCIAGTVLKLNIARGWFYDSCYKCHKKLDRDEAIFFCPKCKKSLPNTVARYRIELGTAIIIIFDNDATMFLGITAEALRKKTSEVPVDTMQTIVEFDRSLGITFVFKVGVQLNNWNPTPSFTVQKMTSNEAIFERFSKQMNVEDFDAEINLGGVASTSTVDHTCADDNTTSIASNVVSVFKEVDGRRLSFSEELTNLGEDTPNSLKRTSSSVESSNHSDTAKVVGTPNSNGVLKKVKLEKN